MWRGFPVNLSTNSAEEPDVKEKKYQTIESVAKKIDINLLLPKVAQSVLVDEALINLKQHIDTSLPSNEKTNIQPKDTYVSEKAM